MLTEMDFPTGLPLPPPFTKEEFLSNVDADVIGEYFFECLKVVTKDEKKFDAYFDVLMLLSNYPIKMLNRLSEDSRKKFRNDINSQVVTPKKIVDALKNCVGALEPGSTVLFPNIFAQLEMLWVTTFAVHSYFEQYKLHPGVKALEERLSISRSFSL
jgi:hypothetical protein